MLGPPHHTVATTKRERAGPFAFSNLEVIGNLHQLVSVGKAESSVGEKQEAEVWKIWSRRWQDFWSS